jgi:hypothetical protein
LYFTGVDLALYKRCRAAAMQISSAEHRSSNRSWHVWSSELTAGSLPLLCFLSIAGCVLQVQEVCSGQHYLPYLASPLLANSWNSCYCRKLRGFGFTIHVTTAFCMYSFTLQMMLEQHWVQGMEIRISHEICKFHA